MPGVNDIKPLGPIWPTPATQPSGKVRQRRKPPERQPKQQQEHDEQDDDDDTQTHIDEYV